MSVFRARLKVCFGDIDNAGIVYYPRFLHYFHVAIEEFFSNVLEMEYAEVLHEHGLAFPTVHIESDFRRPLVFGDHIDVEVRVLKIGRTSITWGYSVHKSGRPEEIVVEGHNVTVSMHMKSFTKMDIPDWLRKKLETYRKDSQ